MAAWNRFLSYLPYPMILNSVHRGFTLLWISLSIVRYSDASELLLEHSSRPVQAESSLEALVPWETPISGFFIRSHFGQPVIDESQWILRIDGLVEHPLTLSLDEIKKLDFKSLHAVLECSGNGRGLQTPKAPGVQWKKGAVGNAEWGGVPLKVLFRKAGIKSEARFATLEGADKPTLPSVPGFIRSVPLEKLQDENTLIAWKMNRQNLPILHGGPIRLVLPGWYGENWIKWITHITLTDKEDTGFFMKKAYKMPKTPLKAGEAWDSSTGIPIEQILVQSFIVSPVSGEKVKRGKIEIRGKAFSGFGSISKVEISLDHGKTWNTTQLEAPHISERNDIEGWQEFNKTISVSEPGEIEILSRATDQKGNQQPLVQAWNPPGYLRNAVDSVIIQIEDSSAPPPERLTERETPGVRQKCLTCHAMELIESQRLTSKQWEGVLKKMETFGVSINPEERAGLLKELAQYSPEQETQIPKRVSYQSIQSSYQQSALYPRGNEKNGKILYQKTCSGCHGSEGEGRIGPRLLGRAIPVAVFWNTVTQGQRSMPPFKDILKKQEIADIEAYLQNPRMR